MYSASYSMSFISMDASPSKLSGSAALDDVCSKVELGLIARRDGVEHGSS